MPVAKTYSDMIQISAPYMKGKRQYIKVRTKTGLEKEVRWYTDAEYKRMYNETAECNVNYREILGFGDAGYITVYLNVDDSNEWILQRDKNCRYHIIWGWYTISTEDPIEIPGVETRKLYWPNVTENGKLTTNSAVKGYEELIGQTSRSQYMGNINDTLELAVMIKGNASIKNAVMNFMVDNDGNEYIWTTSRTLEKGKIYTLKGKVKAHAIHHGIKQTILHYCREVKEL